eukprot:Lithocolla_globosa_v1_NODE_427_length_4089_cov_17.325235.p2 type:complete len:174 gc:universal NODE_427_length_4089_cov_17.325235:1790-2311(+)
MCLIVTSYRSNVIGGVIPFLWSRYFHRNHGLTHGQFSGNCCTFGNVGDIIVILVFDLNREGSWGTCHSFRQPRAARDSMSCIRDIRNNLEGDRRTSTFTGITFHREFEVADHTWSDFNLVATILVVGDGGGLVVTVHIDVGCHSRSSILHSVLKCVIGHHLHSRRGACHHFHT